MPCGREIRLRRVKSLRRREDLFHFTFRVSGKFHNVRQHIISHSAYAEYFTGKILLSVQVRIEISNILFFITSLQTIEIRTFS